MLMDGSSDHLSTTATATTDPIHRQPPSSTSSTAPPPLRDRPYRGVRMRKWGKWVAEIREPNKRSRIWLGSYSTAVAAAKAYDTAVFYLRGSSARLNFPDDVDCLAVEALSAASIRKKATEVGARVDALQQQHLKSSVCVEEEGRRRDRAVCRPDLNRPPSPDSEDDLD